MSAPETVTVVTPALVCVGPYEVGECGCLVAWRNRDYGHTVNAWCEGLILERMIGISTTFNFNEGDPRFTPAKLARARNRATAIMGYVVGNPEGAWGEKHRGKYQDILDLYEVEVYQ